MDPPEKISITICGDGGCGKSSITLRLVRSQWTNSYDPTIEDSYTVSRRIDGRSYTLSITDTAGQEEYRGMWASSNLGADAFLMVYDITSMASLENLEGFMDLINMEEENQEENFRREQWDKSRQKPASSDTPQNTFIRPVKIVAGNKCDLQSQRQVSAQTGMQWARSRNCGFMETSARATVNIEETFALIVRRVTEARRRAERGEESAMMHMGESMMGGFGDRHNVTRPLTPLARPELAESEKNLATEVRRRGDKMSPRDKWLRFWRRLRCWRRV